MCLTKIPMDGILKLLLVIYFQNMCTEHAILVDKISAFLCFLYLRNLLTHTLLFWHFLENSNFKFKNILEYIRTMLSGNPFLFSETTD